MLFRVIARLIKRFFGAINRFFGGIFRFVARHEAGLGVIVIILLVVGGFALLLNALNINIVIGQPQAVAAVSTTAATPTPVVATATPAPATLPTPKVSQLNAPAAAETFLQGQLYFDGAKVWNSMDAELHTQLEGQGQNQQYFEQNLQNLKGQGRKYLQYNFVGSYTGTDKQLICFYVVRYLEGTKIVDLPVTFWLDSDGKIAQYQF